MSSAISDTQSTNVQQIVVSLDQPDLTIEPGSATRLVVTMSNQQTAPDRLLLEVEGIDIEWYNIPVPAVNVAPGASVSERINFKMTRSSENRAGSYPFLVRVVAMETGEVGMAQAMLIVKPFDSLQVEMSPRRAVASFFHPLNDFEVTVANEGNAEEALELFASDPEDDCAYEFDVDHLVLKPGQTQTIPMAARPKASAWIGSPRLYSFSVSARSSEDTYLSAKTQGQIERRALVSPFMGLFLLLLGLGGGGYMAFRPAPLAPVRMNNFAATTSSVMEGKPVTLTWDVSGDKPVIKLFHTIGEKGTEVADGELNKSTGNAQYTPVGPQTMYTLKVTGPGNEGKWQTKSITVNVTAAPTPPKPTLTDFYADTGKVHVGEQVIFSWVGKNANSYILDPGGYTFSGLSHSTPVVMNNVGDIKFQLSAISADKHVQSAPKTVKITVVSKEQSVATIVDFTAPKTVYIGEPFRLRWTAKRTATVRIEDDRGDIIGNNLEPSGSIEAKINDHTIYTLTAADNLGKTIIKQITVVPQTKPLPPPEPLPSPTPEGDKNTNTPPATPPNDSANPLTPKGQ